MSQNIDELMVSSNIADLLTDDEVGQIGAQVISGFNEDFESMQDWVNKAEKGLELAKLITHRKNTPWQNAANVKFPLIAQAALHFSALTYPEVVRNGKVVEVTTVGADLDGSKEQRARRVSEHMSYQLLVESDDWEAALDKLLPMLSVVGTVHKKTWFDPINNRNVSELCNYDELIINNSVKSLEDARRVSHVLHMHKNTILEYIRAGLYSDKVIERLFSDTQNDTDDVPAIDLHQEFHEVVEQHCYFDLDRDGYEEPYIVTVHLDTGTVLRVVARFDPEGIQRNTNNEVIRIKPVQFFTAFHFLPAPDGNYFSMGFGHLLEPLNRTINTTINQLLDAGTLANMQGGFIGKGLRLRGGSMRLSPGEWKKVDMAPGADIKNNVIPLTYKEPSVVLFQLLGSMVQAGKELSSVTDALLGQQPTQNVPATTILATIEQGLKIFSSIQRRIFRSLKSEFSKLYRLNRIFLDPEVYFRTLDEELAILQTDYEDQSLDVHPVSDPNLSSDAQRLARSEALLQLIGQPGVNGVEIIKRYLTDLNTPMIEKILPPPDPNAPPPIDVIDKQSEIQERADKTRLDAMELELKRIEMAAKVEKLRADAIKSLAEAEAAEVGQQLDVYKAELKGLTDITKEGIRAESARQVSPDDTDTNT